MDYLSHYRKLIRKAKKSQDLYIGYFEKHHIIPKCLIKHKSTKIVNGKWNIVKLTPKQHFIAHLLLYRAAKKKYGHKHKITISLLYAWTAMCRNSEGRKILSKKYHALKNELYSNLTGSNNPMYGRKHSLDTKKQMSKKAKIRGNNNHSGRKHSKETIEKIRAAQKGNHYRTGTIHSDETKLKISIAQKERLNSKKLL